jgi:hypothetical protein
VSVAERIEMAEDRMAQLVERLRQDPSLPATLPNMEGAIVQAALDGESIHDIANTQGISEGAVWEVLGNAARAATGQMPTQRAETGGLGSDTDPGVTGGYGDTGFGSLEGDQNPPPIGDMP